MRTPSMEFAIWDAGSGDIDRAERRLRQILVQETAEHPVAIAARARLAHLCLTSGRDDEAAQLAAKCEGSSASSPRFAASMQ
jgi:predicted negative regulator of RcsB-dependent stress response